MPEPETTDIPASTDVLAQLSPEQRQTWRETGDLPVLEPKTSLPDPTPDADSTPAEPAAQAASTDAHEPGASEPPTSTKANAQTRIKQLLEENKSLKARLDAGSSPPRPASTSDVSAASSTAVEVPSLEQVIDRPDIAHPVLTDTEFFTRYPDATVGDFSRYAASYQFDRKQAAAVQTQERTALTGKFAERMAAAVADDPTFFDKTAAVASITPFSLLDGAKPASEHYMAEEILRSDRPAALMVYLSEHPDELATIRRGTPLDAIRTIARLDAKLEPSSVPSAPVVKTTTSAPAPPTTLGTKPVASGDEVEEAVRTGDMRKYRRIMNAREAAG